MTYRSRAFLDLCRNAACISCGTMDWTIVAAHSNEGKGMGHKAPDWCSVPLCHACHREYDQGPAPRDQKRAQFKRWLFKWLEHLFSTGVLGIVGAQEEPTGVGRSLEQNAKLHAMFGELARQVRWHGQLLPLGVWKRLCVAAWLREHGERPIMVPSLDGCGIDVIYERTSRLGKRQMAELIQWVEAFGIEHGCRFFDPHEVVNEKGPRDAREMDAQGHPACR